MSYTDQEFDQVVELNLKGSFIALRETGRIMTAQQSGSIILYSSIRSQVVEPGQSVYAATKAGIVQLVKTAAAEFAENGVRVNAIAPGWFPSEMTRAWVRKNVFLDHISNNSPMGRIGEPRELAGALLLLASGASSFINGEVISVDGGVNASTGLPFFNEEMFEFMEKAVPGGLAKRINSNLPQ